MSDTADWKQKYRDSLLEMQADETRWRQIEQALRRLVGRLCAAGMGVSPQLDDELVALAAANRQNADVAALEALAQSLTTVVIAVDAVAPVMNYQTGAIPAAGTPPLRATSAAVVKILQCLQALNADSDAADELLAKLPSAAADADLAAILDSTAALVRRYGESLARERAAATAVLESVTTRLEEVSGYLAEAGRDVKSRFDDSAAVNENVIAQVQELTAEVNSATELGLLQSLVNSRLEVVTEQVLAFRSREESRVLDQTSRVDRMRARIDDLEREARDLNSKLDQEKHGARVDQLTQLANRKSFEEQIAEVLGKQGRQQQPVTLLLWDLDNFKFINDSYGHRAGDRVLQSVAACLRRGLRGEDFVARIGGEEFVMLLKGLPFNKAAEIADELRIGVEALRFHFRGTPIKVTVSCGFTELRDEDGAGAVFDRADEALYRAKNGGKNVCIAA